MTGALEAAGHEVGGGFAIADAFVLHTCTVTGAARAEALRHVRNARKRGVAHIVVSGCGANTERDAFAAAGADVVVDAKNNAVFGDDVFGIGRLALDSFNAVSPGLPKYAATRASIKIQDGCDFRCAYCIVPDARGAPVSRPSGAILDEIRRLAEENDFREFVLTGVNVATWSHGGMTLCDLIMSIARIGSVARIRLSSVEPSTAEYRIIDLMAAAESKLCHTLHYPLQSGDDGVLKLMRRRYSAGEYAEALDYAAGKIPRLGLGADVITGFPGETDEAFANTRDFILRRPFTYLHVFPYSERPGTPAAEMPGKIPVSVRRARARELIAIGKSKSLAFAESFIGAEAEALVEKTNPARGWTSEYVPAEIPGAADAAPGQIIRFPVLRVENGVVTG